MYSIIKNSVSIPLEAVIWIAGLILLPIVYSYEGVSLCLFHNLGVTFCPGCGLGESMVYLFRLDVNNSFSAHPLGIPALLIILHRIFTLIKFSHCLPERNSHG